MITTLDLASDLIELLRRDALTEDQLRAYLQRNAQILKSNVEQAQLLHGGETAHALEQALPRYAADKERILANDEAFARVAAPLVQQVAHAYGRDVPDIVLVPCLGLYANGGWAERVGDTSYVCVALERLAPGVQLDILLAHEIGHGVAETQWETVLDGFYGEGHATYVSRALCPGHPEAAYFTGDSTWLAGCLDWIDAHREQIARDAPLPIQVLNPQHKFYFTTSYNPDHPNIGYVIGTLYLAHLHRSHSLQALRTFGQRGQENQAAFASFLSAWRRGEGLLPAGRVG